ncbi:GNAT family N-acetyltransferase [Bacillus sp. DJP31]|uniref:GNAT family N-acetyltransferase n=1 Tax=Bacillus sp. DJP31 TaxID=3409789 RepID=UPI003BB4BE31
MKIIIATLDELDSVVELFNQYRMFYKQASDLIGAQEFLRKRIENKESVIFLATHEDKPVGFTQLFPMFSSVSMKRTWILNDLFVSESARRLGVGEALIDAAIGYGTDTFAKGILLETGNENVKAQALYEKIGFKREESYFYFYSL